MPWCLNLTKVYVSHQPLTIRSHLFQACGCFIRCLMEQICICFLWMETEMKTLKCDCFLCMFIITYLSVYMFTLIFQKHTHTEEQMHAQPYSQAGHTLSSYAHMPRLALPLPRFPSSCWEKKSTITYTHPPISLGWGKGKHCNSSGNTVTQLPISYSLWNRH